MNFKTTYVLLNAIQPYTDSIDISITCDGHTSDLVKIDTVNNVGFEVFYNEVIVFYFTDHYHFEDYSSELQGGEEHYIERAQSFLKVLFEYKIRHVEYYKGKTLYSEKYFLLYNDGRNDECIGNTWFGLSKFINPFGKKSIHSTTWQFDKSKGIFTTRQPKAADPNAVEVIDISDDCYIEIFNSHNFYTYDIMEIDFDDHFGMYYWAPAEFISPSGFYDTKDKAIAFAKEALHNRDNL